MQICRSTNPECLYMWQSVLQAPRTQAVYGIRSWGRNIFFSSFSSLNTVRCAQLKPWCTAQTVMHSSNCYVQLKPWCTAQTVQLLAQPSIFFMTHSEPQRTDMTFTTGAKFQAVQTSTLGTQECLNHILMIHLKANTCQPMGGTWTAASKSTASLSVL